MVLLAFRREGALDVVRISHRGSSLPVHISVHLYFMLSVFELLPAVLQVLHLFRLL